MKDGADPADHLKNAVNAIDGFSLSHLLAGAEKAQALTDKSVHIDFVTTGKQGDRNVEFSPLNSVPESLPLLPKDKPKEYVYNAEDFLPMLSYNHSNKSQLEGKIETLVAMLTARPLHLDAGRKFTIPSDFIEEEKFATLGTALILWLKIVIEQQYRKRKVKITDSALAKQLDTSRATISKYKKQLKGPGYLKVEAGGKVQELSVVFFPK